MNNDSRETRVTSMRDPALPSAGINIRDLSVALPVAETGSKYFSGMIDGKWYVLNGHMEKALQTPFATEQEAIQKAAEKCGIPEAEWPDIQSSR
jgi:hypothetical protein